MVAKAASAGSEAVARGEQRQAVLLGGVFAAAAIAIATSAGRKHEIARRAEERRRSEERLKAEEDFEEILAGLRRSISRERRTAIAALVATLVASVYGLVVLLDRADDGLADIAAAASRQVQVPGELAATTIYVLVRGTAFAALVSGMLFALARLARSALDQATRFDKRLIAARFIDYAVHSDHVDAAKMEIALRVLQAWGASVDSAYTPIKVAANRAEIIKGSVGKGGVSAEYHNTSGGD